MRRSNLRWNDYAYYGDPRRKDDPRYLSCYDIWWENGKDEWGWADGEPDPDEPGGTFRLEPDKWYWMYSMPGYLDRGDPEGPFDTWGQAAAAMAEEVWPWEDFNPAQHRFFSLLVDYWEAMSDE